MKMSNNGGKGVVPSTNVGLGSNHARWRHQGSKRRSVWSMRSWIMRNM